MENENEIKYQIFTILDIIKRNDLEAYANKKLSFMQMVSFETMIELLNTCAICSGTTFGRNYNKLRVFAQSFKYIKPINNLRASQIGDDENNMFDKFISEYKKDAQFSSIAIDIIEINFIKKFIESL